MLVFPIGHGGDRPAPAGLKLRSRPRADGIWGDMQQKKRKGTLVPEISVPPRCPIRLPVESMHGLQPQLSYEVGRNAPDKVEHQLPDLREKAFQDRDILCP